MYGLSEESADYIIAYNNCVKNWTNIKTHSIEKLNKENLPTINDVNKFNNISS